jgi:hypothetical protein
MMFLSQINKQIEMVEKEMHDRKCALADFACESSTRKLSIEERKLNSDIENQFINLLMLHDKLMKDKDDFEKKEACDKLFQNMKEETCSICLEPECVVTTQCGHYFHRKCILKWCKSGNYSAPCPICRNIVNSSNIQKNKNQFDIILEWYSRCLNKIAEEYSQKIRSMGIESVKEIQGSNYVSEVYDICISGYKKPGKPPAFSRFGLRCRKFLVTYPVRSYLWRLKYLLGEMKRSPDKWIDHIIRDMNMMALYND